MEGVLNAQSPPPHYDQLDPLTYGATSFGRHLGVPFVRILLWELFMKKCTTSVNLLTNNSLKPSQTKFVSTSGSSSFFASFPLKPMVFQKGYQHADLVVILGSLDTIVIVHFQQNFLHFFLVLLSLEKVLDMFTLANFFVEEENLVPCIIRSLIILSSKGGISIQYHHFQSSRVH